MSATIQLLPDSLINQIAAGEVIENPSSVVKELVENSIDAQATQIGIEIKGGGLQKIVIHDNGSGMSPQDLLLSIERHATSKIRHFTDLFSLLSMGFRGEALASIASISKMTIESAQEKKTAHLLEIDGGKIIENRQGAREKGTTIEVFSLFFNVPARRKFQKSIGANVAMIKKTVDLLALAHPEIGFSLKVQDVDILQTQPHFEGSWAKKTEKRIKEVLGETFFSTLVPLSFTEGPFSFHGWIGLPAYAKKSRSGQYLFINRRVVFSPAFASGIKDGYSTAIGEGFYPFFVVYLDIPPDFVDVNVHPQKKEVRLRDEFFLKEKIKEATTLALAGQKDHSDETIVEDFSLSPYFFHQTAFQKALAPLEKPQDSFMQEELFSLDTLPSKARFQEIFLLGSYLLIEMKSFFSENLSHFAKFSDKNSSLFIVDLEAASARLLFDAICNKDHEPLFSQQLLFPITLELSNDEILKIRGHLDELLQIGVEARILGQKTLAIDALPFFVAEEKTESFLTNVLEDISLFGKIDDSQENHKKRVARKICSFVRGSKKEFTLEEAKILIENLLTSKAPYHDPLGNPTMRALSLQLLEKLFTHQEKDL